MAFVQSSLVLLVVVGVALAGTVLTEKQKQYHEECKKSSGVTKEVFEKAHTGVFEDDAAFKQYFLCMGKKFNYFNDANELQIEEIKKSYAKKLKDEALADKIVKKCVEKKATPEDTALFISSCYFRESPDTIKFDFAY